MRNIISTLILISATSVQAASFDCSLAQTTIEKTICSNPEISKADETLSTLYSNIRGQARYANDLTKNQLAWLKERNTCKSDPCILEKYKAREVELNGWLQKEAEKAKELENCTDRPECWPEGSAMHTGLTLAAGQKKSSEQLKAKHDELITLLSESPNHNGEKYPDDRVISALKAQQLSWDKYKSDECELIASLTGAGGSWPSTYATECDANLTEERQRRVTSAIKCVKKIPLDKRWMDQAACLQQLAPLANKL